MIPHKVNFLVTREKDQPDGLLRMRVRWGDDIRVQVNVGCRIDPAKWSKESQRVKANTTHGKRHIPASTINAVLQRYEQAAEDAFLRFDVRKAVPTADEYRAELRSCLGRGEESKQETPLVHVLISEYIAKESVLRSWSDRTRCLCEEVRRTLIAFDPGLRIGDFDGKRFEEFFFWMAEDREYANRTIRQWMMSTRAFLRWAKEDGQPVPDSALAFSPRVKLIPKTVVWLNWDELQSLFSYRDSKSLRESWRDVLDCFLLACFTGLRDSDVRNLRWSDVGENHICVVTKKTSAPLYIDLNKYSRAIIGWHRDDPDCVDFVMPRIDRYNTPATLKRICRDAGIVDKVTITSYKCGGKRIEEEIEKYKAVSMHTGRRTFICNALALGISPLTVMKWTGHKDYTSMKPYIDISDVDKKQAMSKFDK